MPSLKILVPTASGKVCISCRTKENTSKIGNSKAVDIYCALNIAPHIHQQSICNACNLKQLNELTIICEQKTQDSCIHLIRLMQALRVEVNSSRSKHRGLDMNSLNDKEFEDCTRICRFDFRLLMQASRYQNEMNMFIFLTMCFWGITQRAAGVIFAKSQTTISRIFNEVLNYLSSEYVPNYLGIDAIPKEEIIEQHTPFLISKLLPYVRLIGDGTYIYIQKPSDFEHQKMSYSMQKRRNLLKFLAYVAPDGHFIEMLGPYFSNGSHNDEWLHNQAINDPSNAEFFDSFDSDDEFLFDRGFQRCEEAFSFHVPRSITKGKTALDTEDANYTRILTRFRNVVERAFGRLKQWRIIDGVVPIALIENLQSLIRVLCAKSNHLFEPLFKNNPEQDQIDLEILDMKNLRENEVKKIVEGLNPRESWRIISDEAIKELVGDISESWIRSWNAGIYALNLAEQYIKRIERLKVESLTLPSNQGVLLRFKGISSRFHRKKHTVYINVSSTVVDTTFEDFSNISGYCTCKNGSRTIGGCAHIVATLKFFANLRQGRTIKKSKTQVSFECVKDVTDFKRRRIEERQQSVFDPIAMM